MSERGSDPIGDLQRWLMKAGARSLGRDVADRVRSTAGGGRGKTANVWETATTEPPGDEPPECQWCPICRAARRYRDSGSTTGAGLSSQLAGVGDTLAGFTRDAFSIVEAAMRASQRPASTGTGPSAGTGKSPSAGEAAPGSRPNGASDSGAQDSSAPDSGATDSGATDSSVWDSATADRAQSDHGTVVGPGVAWPTAVHPEDEHGEAADEGGDREEGGEPGDRPADGRGDEQVEGPAE